MSEPASPAPTMRRCVEEGSCSAIRRSVANQRLIALSVVDRIDGCTKMIEPSRRAATPKASGLPLERPYATSCVHFW